MVKAEEFDEQILILKLRLSKIYRWSHGEFFLLRTQLKLLWPRFRKMNVIFFVGTPKHSNLGDQAIFMAMTKFTKARTGNTIIVSIPMPVVMRSPNEILHKLIKEQDILVGMGGGNMGDTYMGEEICRRMIIEGFPYNTIIIFPQTMYFSDSTNGRRELQKTMSIYAKHTNLTIISRERTSYEAMLSVFPRNVVLLAPDIVLSINYSVKKYIRNGLLLCIRDDIEGRLNGKAKHKIAIFSENHFNYIRHTDTVSSRKFFAIRPKKRAVISKLMEFSTARLVITDRLHGMVFAAVTGTPCIVLSNFNHKVSGSYKWLETLPYIKFCNNVNELDAVFQKIDLDQLYDYEPSNYNKYWIKIANRIISSQ